MKALPPPPRLSREESTFSSSCCCSTSSRWAAFNRALHEAPLSVSLGSLLPKRACLLALLLLSCIHSWMIALSLSLFFPYSLLNQLVYTSESTRWMEPSTGPSMVVIVGLPYRQEAVNRSKRSFVPWYFPWNQPDLQRKGEMLKVSLSFPLSLSRVCT